MKFIAIFCCLYFIMACRLSVEPAPEAADTTTVLPQPVSLLRDTIKKKAVASFEKKIPQSLNDWYFKVAVFETRERFSFLVKMQYEAIAATDTIRIPNLQVEPTISLQPGKGPYSCIIGFHDKEGVFKPYKEVTATGDQLRITTIRHYAVMPVQ